MAGITLKRSLLNIFIFSILAVGCSNSQNDPNSGSSLFQNATFTTSSSRSNQLELQDYVRELVAEMALNMNSVDSTAAIAVTNFVFADSEYNATDDLGFTLSDAFMQELHSFGFTTLDFKVTNFIRITPQGDFALSRDYQELNKDISISYILVGTLTHVQQGYILHARIVDIESKHVLATGKTLIPQKIASQYSNT
jgi:TolB-like protein